MGGVGDGNRRLLSPSGRDGGAMGVKVCDTIADRPNGNAVWCAEFVSPLPLSPLAMTTL